MKNKNYKEDIVAFAEDYLDMRLSQPQRELLRLLKDNKRMVMPFARKSGRSICRDVLAAFIIQKGK